MRLKRAQLKRLIESLMVEARPSDMPSGFPIPMSAQEKTKALKAFYQEGVTSDPRKSNWKFVMHDDGRLYAHHKPTDSDYAVWDSIDQFWDDAQTYDDDDTEQSDTALSKGDYIGFSKLPPAAKSALKAEWKHTIKHDHIPVSDWPWQDYIDAFNFYRSPDGTFTYEVQDEGTSGHWDGKKWQADEDDY